MQGRAPGRKPYSVGATVVPKNGYIFISSRGLLRPLRGSGFALGQPDRLRRQAHLELGLADVAASESAERGGNRGGGEYPLHHDTSFTLTVGAELFGTKRT